MRVAVLVSGGKDSALALHRVLQEGHTVEFLLAMMPEREDSWMFHVPNIHLTKLFAEAAGIPLKQHNTSGIKERELDDLRTAISTLQVEGVVSGAITSTYQKDRIDKICRELTISHQAPLWHDDQVQLLKELVDWKFEVIITGVYAYGFDESWLGRKIDSNTINALRILKHKHDISIAGEGGEYETLVLDAPFYKKRIRLIKTEKLWEGERGQLVVQKADLIDEVNK